MKTGSKVLLGVSGAALLVAGSVFGTLAYLTSTHTVTNTFTIGTVGIKLEETELDDNFEPVTEAETDENGKNITSKTDKGNHYRVIPGREYIKDPTMTVLAGSDEAYLRMMMTIKDHKDVQAIIDNAAHGLTDYADLLGGWDDEVWLYEGFTTDEKADTITFEFRYFETVDGFDGVDENGKPIEADKELDALFDTLIIPGTLTNEEVESLDKFEMVLEGHAIQATGFEDDADGAWAAFDTQQKAE